MRNRLKEAVAEVLYHDILKRPEKYPSHLVKIAQKGSFAFLVVPGVSGFGEAVQMYADVWPDILKTYGCTENG